jgi:hypothetical protein
MKKILLFCGVLLLSTVVIAQTPTVSASSVTFRYCQTSQSTVNVNVWKFPYTWMGHEYTQAGQYVETLTNVRGCDSIVTLNLVYTNGAIPFPFTINASGKQVYFSMGNLQYRAASTDPNEVMTHTTKDGQNTNGVWRFALNQWDYVGWSTNNYNYLGNVYQNDVQCNNVLNGITYTGWVDLFLYGQSGYNNWANATADFANNINYDWGEYNGISNGGNQPQMWSTLTYQEWEYIVNSRTNAMSLRSFGTVENVKGLILLPDNWQQPSGLLFASGSSCSVNVYSADEWKRMEENGAIFLPRGYCRYVESTSANIVDGWDKVLGFYMSANKWNWNGTCTLSIQWNFDGAMGTGYYGSGATTGKVDQVRGSVRLVRRLP